ncbi:MAG: hypothetical protein KAW81_00305 [Dehalococcoidia bacterium]|nr:hypothetical protein [Dehalococcoidia bacterium]
MAFTIYISHSTSPWELAHVYTLANEVTQHGLDFFIPDRTWDPYSALPERIFVPLSQADVILLFATCGGQHLDWINSEIGTISQGKPLIALVEPKVQPQGIAPQNIIWFDRENPTIAMDATIKRLQSLNLTNQMTGVLTGFLIGSLALILLRGLTKKDKKAS